MGAINGILMGVYAVVKMNITTETSFFMSEDQFDVRKGPNSKMQQMCI